MAIAIFVFVYKFTRQFFWQFIFAHHAEVVPRPGENLPPGDHLDLLLLLLILGRGGGALAADLLLLLLLLLVVQQLLFVVVKVTGKKQEKKNINTWNMILFP